MDWIDNLIKRGYQVTILGSLKSEFKVHVEVRDRLSNSWLKAEFTEENFSAISHQDIKHLWKTRFEEPLREPIHKRIV